MLKKELKKEIINIKIYKHDPQTRLWLHVVNVIGSDKKNSN